MLSANKDSFISSFPICMPFWFFLLPSCTDWALQYKGEYKWLRLDILALVPDLKGKQFSTIKYFVHCMFFRYLYLLQVKKSPSLPCSVFLTFWKVVLSQWSFRNHLALPQLKKGKYGRGIETGGFFFCILHNIQRSNLWGGKKKLYV